MRDENLTLRQKNDGNVNFNFRDIAFIAVLIEFIAKNVKPSSESQTINLII